MKATIPHTTVQQVGVDKISVGQVTVGPIAIGSLVIDNFSLGMSTGAVELKNFRLTIGLELSLDWSISISVWPFGSWGDSGTIDLGNPSITINFGNVGIPGIQSFTIDISSIDLTNLTASSVPISNLQLGGLVAQQIQAQNVVLPSQGFTVAGLAFGSLNAGGVGVPAATANQVTIGQVKGSGLPIGQVSLSNLTLPATNVADIISDAIKTQAVGPTYQIGADLAVLDVTLNITPDATAAMDSLSITGVKSSGSIGKIQMSNVVAPYELMNMTLSQIGIQTITVPTLAIA